MNPLKIENDTLWRSLIAMEVPFIRLVRGFVNRIGLEGQMLGNSFRRQNLIGRAARRYLFSSAGQDFNMVGAVNCTHERF